MMIDERQLKRSNAFIKDFSLIKTQSQITSNDPRMPEKSAAGASRPLHELRRAHSIQISLKND